MSVHGMSGIEAGSVCILLDMRDDTYSCDTASADCTIFYGTVKQT